MRTLQENDLPALYHSSDQLSLHGQTRAKFLVGLELLLLILAGATGITTLRVGPAHVDVLALLGVVAFLGALLVIVWRILRKPEGDWYTGRAAAESVRTLAWRYAVGGDPFPIPAPSGSADERFIKRLREILTEIGESELEITSAGLHEVSPGMRAIRGDTFEKRKTAYLTGRIGDQLSWYSAKAVTHRRAANRWVWIAAAATLGGFLAALLKALNVTDVDLLGVAASCATSAIAWNQMSQHRTLVSSYALAARELNLIRDQFGYILENDWAIFVSDAEDAISREHTMWLARRGHPGIRRPA